MPTPRDPVVVPAPEVKDSTTDKDKSFLEEIMASIRGIKESREATTAYKHHPDKQPESTNYKPPECSCKTVNKVVNPSLLFGNIHGLYPKSNNSKINYVYDMASLEEALLFCTYMIVLSVN